MVGLSVLATTGQLSIYYIVKNFQPYTTAIITTVRKIITIMLSIVLFKHHIVPMQWSGIVVVFFGVLLEMKDEISDKFKKRKETNAK
jgi:UDP-galactose transporter B1